MCQTEVTVTTRIIGVLDGTSKYMHVPINLGTLFWKPDILRENGNQQPVSDYLEQ